MTRLSVHAASLACAALVALLASADSAALRAQAGRDAAATGAVQGVPWIGAPGIADSAADIMARTERAAAAGHRPLSTRARDRRRDRNRNLHDDPSAPPVSRWPWVDPAGAADAATSVHAATERSPFLPQTVVTNFLGAQVSESGFIPPDSMGAVSPTQIMVTVNGRIKVFDKTGSLGPLNTTADLFFQSVLPPASAGTSDPRVVWDPLSNRFYISMISVDTPNRILLAVSSGATITGTSSFTFFQFQHDLVGPTPNSDTGGFADYDTLGVDANAAYVGANVFNAAGTALLGTTGYVIRKSSLLDGGPIVVTPFRQLATSAGPGPFTPQGVTNDDPAATEGYFIGVDNAAFSLLVLRRILNPGGVPSISSNLNITVPTTRFPRTVPALGSTAALDALDDRLMNARIKNGSLWAAHNINVDAAGVATTTSGTLGRNGVRWYEIDPSTVSLKQAGTLFDSTAVASGTARHHWIPSIAVSGQGHVAIGASAAAPVNSAGTQIQPSVAVAGRLASDPLGTIQAPTIAKPGAGNYNIQLTPPQRWGDFSATHVDPSDNMTMWTFQEYSNANNSWGVQVIRLLAPPPATPSSVVPSTIPAGATGVNLTLSGSIVNGSGFYDPGPGYPSRIAALISGGGITINSITFTNPTTIVLNVDVAPGATPGARSITVTNPDGQSATSASPLLTIEGLNATPTVTLKINGQRPTPPIVTTSGPVLLTLDVSPSALTTPVAWFWALTVNNQLLWVTASGLSTTPAPLVVAPPVAINNATLLNFTLPAGATVGSLFFFVDGGTVIAFDAIAATRPAP
jgi:hypothetical protein